MTTLLFTGIFNIAWRDMVDKKSTEYRKAGS